MSADKVVASDVPARYLFPSFVLSFLSSFFLAFLRFNKGLPKGSTSREGGSKAFATENPREGF